MKKHVDPGCDGMDLTEILVLVHDAARAYPTRMPPQDAQTDEARLWKLKRRLYAARRLDGGRGMPETGR